MLEMASEGIPSLGESPAPFVGGMPLGGGSLAVMGILNVTPDSFSDGGLWTDPSNAVSQGMSMADQGALIIDVGGESTRPGAGRVPVEDEWARIGEVIHRLVSRGLRVSVDTINAETARRATTEGACLINDVSGGMHDRRIVQVAVDAQVPMVVQHWRGFPSDPDLNTDYDDVVGDVSRETLDQVELVVEAGLRLTQVVIDPGLGFAQTMADSWTIVDRLESFTGLGVPVLVGASRKRFIATRFPGDVERGTLETTRRAAAAGAWAVRVHDVEAHVRLIEELS